MSTKSDEPLEVIHPGQRGAISGIQNLSTHTVNIYPPAPGPVEEAIGQVEEAMGFLEDDASNADIRRAFRALERAREFLVHAKK